MTERCEECGAPLPAGGACRDLFHELLALEGEFPGAPGSILHFYAVATYNLQHPMGSGLTTDALAGLRLNLADALDGVATLPELRARARRATDGATRVLRRTGDAPPAGWRRDGWPLTVADLLEATAETYPALVTGWARSVRAALDQDKGR
jgi:hypothetical protein